MYITQMELESRVYYVYKIKYYWKSLESKSLECDSQFNFNQYNIIIE